jgi:hypothetical protein
MAKVNLHEKTHLDMELFDIVKFQIISHCFFSKISLNETEYNCLALLAISGKTRLIDFCRKAADMGFLSNHTAVNNCLARIDKSKLFLKEGAGKKMIYINPELKLQTRGNILVKYTLLRKSESDEA